LIKKQEEKEEEEEEEEEEEYSYTHCTQIWYLGNRTRKGTERNTTDYRVFL